MSGEAHLLCAGRAKYVLRRCADRSKALSYERLSGKFGRYGFLPSILERSGSDVIYEYIEGRDLVGRWECLANIAAVGRILGILNSHSFHGAFHDGASRQLEELSSGNYEPSVKVTAARRRRGVTEKPDRILDAREAGGILSCYERLRGMARPTVSYDCSDPTPGNFRLRRGKVYLTDVESILPRYRGYGVWKFFREWGRSASQKGAFMEGYRRVGNPSFLTSEYEAFIELAFLIKKLNFEAQTGKETGNTLARIRKITACSD